MVRAISSATIARIQRNRTKTTSKTTLKTHSNSTPLKQHPRPKHEECKCDGVNKSKEKKDVVHSS